MAEKIARGSGKHSFSIEMKSKNHLKKISVSDEFKSEVLFEGELGAGVGVDLIEGIMLQITGENGVFRIDLTEGELRGVLSVTKTSESRT